MRIRLLLFLIFYSLYNLHLYAVNDAKQFEDSLIRNIKNEKSIPQKLENYIQLIQYFQLNNFNKAKEYSDSAYEIAIKANNLEYQYLISFEKIRIDLSTGNFDKGKADLDVFESEIHKVKNDRVLGNYYLLKNYISDFDGNIVGSMDFALKALNYFLLSYDTIGLAKTYNNIGVTYDNIGSSQKAIEYYLIAIDYALAINNKDVLISTYNNLGVFYNNILDNEKAHYYYTKALNLAYENSDVYTITGELNNIALLYLDEKNYKEALSHFHKALKLTQKLNYMNDEALICNNLGELFRELNKYDSSYYYLQRSIKIYQELKENMSLSISYYTMAELFQAKGDLNNAILYFKKIPALFNEHRVHSIVEETYAELSNIYIDKKNYKKGYDYLVKANEIKDSLSTISRDDKLAYTNMQIDFRTKVEEYESGIKKAEMEHLKKLDKEKQIKLLIILFTVFLVFVLILVYIRFRKSNVLNELLVKQNKEIENQKSLIEISNIEINEQYAFTETLLNTIPNPVFYTDKTGSIIGCNAAFEKTIGDKESELVGTNIQDIHKKAQFACDLVEKFSSSEISEVTEGTMISADGVKRDIICYKQEIIEHDDTLIGILGIIIDVTKIRAVEKSLTLSKKKLKEANNAKDKFFSIMAHDLKNPFNAVLGLTHLISNKMDHFTPDEIKNYASLINQSANHIFNLLENILEWARAQSGAIVINPVVFDVNEPISECLELLENSIQQKSIKVEFDNLKEVSVCADKNMILTVFRNIISNAIKYTPNGETISINTSLNNSYINIDISDNGVGISEENMDKLFKIDQPISTPGLQKEQGTGLGLIICKEFVTQNKGLINVKSELGKGSTFTISLPYK